MEFWVSLSRAHSTVSVLIGWLVGVFLHSSIRDHPLPVSPPFRLDVVGRRRNERTSPSFYSKKDRSFLIRAGPPLAAQASHPHNTTYHNITLHYEVSETSPTKRLVCPSVVFGFALFSFQAPLHTTKEGINERGMGNDEPITKPRIDRTDCWHFKNDASVVESLYISDPNPSPIHSFHIYIHMPLGKPVAAAAFHPIWSLTVLRVSLLLLLSS